MYFIILSIILLASAAIRVFNLNYNSPFTDEAIYVVIGRLGLFQFDWGTYNAAAWVAGSVYIYPVLTALSYMLFGIVGSRFFNVLLGVLTVETIFALTTLLSPIEDKRKYLAGLIAAALIGGAATSLYVSRLATYDMPAFFFLFLSLYLLILAQRPNGKISKWYFLSAVFLILSFATKIINGVFLPLIIVYSFFQARQIDTLHKNLWRSYFFYPCLMGIVLYVVTNLGNNIAYLSGQASLEKASLNTLFGIFSANTFYLWILWIIGSLGMLVKRQWKLWLGLTICAILIPLVHFSTRRLATFDKHIFLTIAFLSIIAGLGISNITSYISQRVVKAFSYTTIYVLLLIFWLISYKDSQKFNSQWENATPVLNYLSEEIRPNDKLLTEAGPPAILATYERNYPINTTTFDWFEYHHNAQGDDSYAQAVKDGYFDVIEIEDENKDKNSLYSRVHKIVAENITDEYRLIYSKDGYQIFRRVY